MQILSAYGISAWGLLRGCFVDMLHLWAHLRIHAHKCFEVQWWLNESAVEWSSS